MAGTLRWRIELLDWLYDFRPDQPGEMASFGAFVDGTDLDEHTQAVWRDILGRLRDERLIKLTDGMELSSYSAVLTPDGRSDVAARRERRSNPALRSPAARDAVVRWLYGQKEPRDLKRMESNRAVHHEGSSFTTDELDVALTYLRRKGLVQGAKMAETVMLQPRLTVRGIDCAEQFGGSVDEYLRSTEFSAATTTGIPTDQVKVLVAAIMQAIPVLGLPEQDAATLSRDAATVQAELGAAEPDQGMVGTLMTRIGTTLADNGGTPLAAVLDAARKQLTDSVGLPGE